MHARAGREVGRRGYLTFTRTILFSCVVIRNTWRDPGGAKVQDENAVAVDVGVVAALALAGFSQGKNRTVAGGSGAYLGNRSIGADDARSQFSLLRHFLAKIDTFLEAGARPLGFARLACSLFRWSNLV